VEEGTPFCKHCGAPQIRVVTAAAESPVAVQPPESSEARTPLQPLRLPVIPSGRVEWAQALPAAALGGVCALMTMVIPYAVFGPAFLLGGAVAVMFYCRRKDRSPTPSAGAKIGAVSGGLGFLFVGIRLVATLVYHPEELRKPLLDNMAQLTGRGYDVQMVKQLEDTLKTQAGLTVLMVLFMVVLFVIFVTGASIGGAFCAAWLRKRTQV
jgi:amino acid transporter